MTESNPVKNSEKEIDNFISTNPLCDIQYAQSMWTLLSVMEDKYLSITQIHSVPDELQHAQIDVLLNAFSHPVRAIYRNNRIPAGKLDRQLIDEHYGWSVDWVENAVIYNNFCSIYSLYWKGKTKLDVVANHISTSDWNGNDLRYEVYNRLIRKDGDASDLSLDAGEIIPHLLGNISHNGQRFDLNLNPKLVHTLRKWHSSQIESRYKIPADWQCQYFTFGDFKIVFTTIQSVLYGRHISRILLASNGLEGLGYSDSVWVLPLVELENRIVRYTGLKISIVRKVIEYLIFGGVGIRDPDVAIQPIIDLKNGFLALSPFLFINSNAERNFCVLLNKIPTEKKLYSVLTNSKEDVLNEEIRREIEGLGYELVSGDLSDTDLDLAVIDRNEKICIVFELKWFIEPAEIRETLERSEELATGVEQAKKKLLKFSTNDMEFVKDLLNIDMSYQFYAAVGSRNWIGNFDVQDNQVPIVKIKHFVEKLKESKDLKITVNWLMSRQFLPQASIDFEIVDMPLRLGDWTSRWYGIKQLFNGSPLT